MTAPGLEYEGTRDGRELRQSHQGKATKIAVTPDWNEPA